jgi:hypothetical protein
VSANPPLLTPLKRSNAATAANLTVAAAWMAAAPAVAAASAATADPRADAAGAAAAPQNPTTRFVSVPYPLGPEKLSTLKEILEKLLWRFDPKGKVEPTIVKDDKTGIRRYGAYLFFNSKRFAPDRTIDFPSNPFHRKKFGDLEKKFTSEGFKIEDQKTKEDKVKADFMGIVATEFKIHLMPNSGYMLATIKSMFDFLALHPEYAGFIHSIKVTRQPGLEDKSGKVLPSIVIYPALGKNNFIKILEFLHAVFPNEICKAIGSAIVPRFNRIINELIFYSNGGGDFKYSLNQFDRARFLSLSQVHFWGCEPITKDIEGIFGIKLPATSFEIMPQPFAVAAERSKIQFYEAYEGPANIGDPVYLPVEDGDADMKDANDFAGAAHAAVTLAPTNDAATPYTPPLRFSAKRSLAISSPDLKTFSDMAMALSNNVATFERLKKIACSQMGEWMESDAIFESEMNLEQEDSDKAVIVRKRPRK